MMAAFMKYSRNRSVVFLAALLVICCFSIIIRVNVALKHSFPEGDEGPWLRMAARAFSDEFLQSNIVEHDLYFERKLPHPEDNRSPLFPLILSSGKLISDNLFRGAQFVNIALSGIMLLLFGWVTRKRIGIRTSLAGMLFVSVSPLFIVNTAHIYCDVTMAFGFYLALLLLHTAPDSRRNASAAGIGIGLLFLVKTSAVFLCIPLLFSFIISGNPRKLNHAMFFMVPFGLLAGSWILRNIVVFGAPLYQFTGYILFTDSMSEVFGVDGSRPGLGSYLASHGFAATFVQRPLIGLRQLAVQMLTHDHYLSVVLLPFAVYGGWRLIRMRRLPASIVLFSIPYVGVMAYAAYGFWVDRYMMIYYLFIYTFAAAGMVFCVERLRQPILRNAVFAGLAAIPLVTVVYPIEYYLSPRGSEKDLDNAARSIITEIRAEVPDTVAVLSSFLSGYAFMHDMRVVNLLNYRTPEKLRMIDDIYSVKYALIDTIDAGTLDLIRKSVQPRPVVRIRQNGSFGFYKIAD